MGSRTILYLTLFLAIAGVAGIFARAYFTEQTADAAVEAEPTGPKIIVAARDLEVGAFLTTQDIRWQASKDANEVILSQHFVEGAADLATLVGAVVRRPLAADQAVTIAQIIKPGQRGFLAAVLRPGTRAVTVEIDEVSGNSGLIFPGDHVDLILTLELKGKTTKLSRRLSSETILSNIRVIAMGQRVETFASIEAEPDARLATTATLEVAPEFAERVNVAQQLGRLALSLRSLTSASEAAEAPIGGEIPTYEANAKRMTWAADVSLALRHQEEQLNAQPEPEAALSTALPPPPPKLLVMRGAESMMITPGEPTPASAPVGLPGVPGIPGMPTLPGTAPQ